MDPNPAMDSTMQFKMTLTDIIEQVSKSDVAWNNYWNEEEDFIKSLADLLCTFNTLKDVSQTANVAWEETCFQNLERYVALPCDILGGRSSILKGNEVLKLLVVAAVSEQINQAAFHCPALKTIDLDIQSSSSTPSDPLKDMFSATIGILDAHPENHVFAKSTEYKPEHAKSFVKSVSEQLNQLKTICTTESQTKMGILARTYEERMDLMSILMRGPEGTPYENTVQIFEAHLPPSYPTVPPIFHFHSFNAGRLNPNLYAEGTVCVSLLGTWSGSNANENWTNNSTISQVLLSIQGLILVREPFYNEPGQKVGMSSMGSLLCRQYNQQLSPLIINMMINQITFGLDPFTEIINGFYRHEIPILLARWKKWLTAENEETLGNDKPCFSLFPMDKTFKDLMHELLSKLHKIWILKLASH